MRITTVSLLYDRYVSCGHTVARRPAYWPSGHVFEAPSRQEVFLYMWWTQPKISVRRFLAGKDNQHTVLTISTSKGQFVWNIVDNTIHITQHNAIFWLCLTASKQFFNSQCFQWWIHKIPLSEKRQQAIYLKGAEHILLLAFLSQYLNSLIS